MNPRVLLVAITTLASGGLFWLGTGPSPHPWATALAALPVLLASLRLGWRTSALVAGLAWLLGTANQWTYLHIQLELPVPALVAFTVGTSALFAAAVSLWRPVVRTSPLLATIALPASWAAAEYVVSLLTPHGAYWSLAYAATDVGWLRHLASLTGPWGITFVLLLPAAAIAATASTSNGPGIGSGRRISSGRRVAPLLVTAGLVVLVAGYGLWPVTADGPTVRVGLVSVAQPDDPVAMPIETPAGSTLLRSYLDAIDSLAGRGARVIVAPEKVFEVTTAKLSTVVDPLGDLAARRQVTIVIGLTLVDTAASYNVALAITSTRVVRYDKHHLIPGLEADFQSGTDLASVDGYALTVCKDMDFPSLMRDIGDTGLVLAPALDFRVDSWSHSRMAILRGVESGFSVARAGRSGALTASDPGGRVRAEAIEPTPSPEASNATTSPEAANATTSPDATNATTSPEATNTTTALADLPTTPVTTVYERLPDAFAWLCLAILLLSPLPALLRRRTRADYMSSDRKGTAYSSW